MRPVRRKDRGIHAAAEPNTRRAAVGAIDSRLRRAILHLKHGRHDVAGDPVLDEIVGALLPLAELGLLELDLLVGDRLQYVGDAVDPRAFLSSEGTIHHGACAVSVIRIISS